MPKNARSPGVRFTASRKQSREQLKMSEDFTAYARFRVDGGRGTLFSKSPPKGKWAPDAKALFVRGGRLVYDIGWKGNISSRKKIDDGEWHHAVLQSNDGDVSLFVDGKKLASEADFTSPDPRTFVFKIGAASPDFGLDFTGDIENVRFWERALNEEEISLLSRRTRNRDQHSPILNWSPDSAKPTNGPVVEGEYVAYPINLKRTGNVEIQSISLEPLSDVNHEKLISQWDHNALDRGSTIYNSLCVTCHGTVEKEGTLPTALRFHNGEFKNGSDPYRMYETISKGFGQMVAQTWMTPRQKYDVIHYIRETFLRPHNSKYYSDADDGYLASLPTELELAPIKPLCLAAMRIRTTSAWTLALICSGPMRLKRAISLTRRSRFGLIRALAESRKGGPG